MLYLTYFHTSICIWACQWLFAFLFLGSLIAQAQAQSRNITIPTTSPQIVYTPFLCNTSTEIVDPLCNGAWKIVYLDGTMIVTTDGPDPTAANIIPQMFLRVRASAMYIITSRLSNATMSVTVSGGNISASDVFNSSVGIIDIVNLRQTDTTTIAITYVPDNLYPTRLDISSLMLTVPDDAASSVIFPTMTLPPSSSPPIFTPLPTITSSSSSSSSPTPVPKSSNHTLVAEGVGIVLGLGLGLTAVAVVGYIVWRRRRRRRGDSESEASAPPEPPPPPEPSPSRWFMGLKKSDTTETKTWF